jgi:hypothetical protein
VAETQIRIEAFAADAEAETVVELYEQTKKGGGRKMRPPPDFIVDSVRTQTPPGNAKA